MLDAIAVPPIIHVVAGTLTLIGSLLALVVTAWAARRQQPFTTRTHASLILFQLTLMAQVLVGIKLLDQGFGPLQLYIHYLGGVAPLAFCLLFYWLPTAGGVAQSRRAAAVSGLSFVFVLMTFAIGSMYVPGGL